jgi:hypothetical protein
MLELLGGELGHMSNQCVLRMHGPHMRKSGQEYAQQLC